MTGPTNYPTPATLDTWMRHREKSETHLGRRRQITKASDLVGPGIDTYAVEINDWNSETARFNGYYFGPAGTPNSPWINGDHLGITVTTGIHGVQMLWSHQAGLTADVEVFVRSMHTHANALPAYGNWLSMANTRYQANVEPGTIIIVAEPPGLHPPGNGPDLFRASYLWCDGDTYNIADYPALVEQIGSYFGGDGDTTFAVPTLANPGLGMRYAIKT